MYISLQIMNHHHIVSYHHIISHNLHKPNVFMSFSRMRSEGFPFISWESGGWRCVRRSWLERPQSFATVRNRSPVDAVSSIGPAVGGSSCRWLFTTGKSVYSIVICMKVLCHARKVMHFAAQAQGFVKVTRLRRSSIGICSFRVVFWRCWIALFHWDLQLQGGLKSSVFVTSLR